MCSSSIPMHHSKRKVTQAQQSNNNYKMQKPHNGRKTSKYTMPILNTQSGRVKLPTTENDTQPDTVLQSHLVAYPNPGAEI